MTNETTIEILNDLLTKAYDGERGYAKASEHAGDCPNLVAFFDHQRALRRTLAADLRDAITRLGGEPDDGSSVAAKAHRVWIAVKDFATGDDEDAVLAECKRGEEAAIHEYNEALEKHDLSAEVVKLLRNHRQQIAEALGFIRAKAPSAS